MSDSPPTENGAEEQDIPVVLPSDPQWRLDVYFKMMESQKHPMPAPWPETEEESEAKRPRVSEDSRSRESRRSIQSAGGLSWSSADLAVAAKLLETPNARFPTITFASVEEKRRVFTLVYDVLRYKSVLNQALSDVHFFTRYSYLKERCHLVWLLFLDLYKRDFTPRDPLEPEVEAAFAAQGLFEIDETLWQLRVKLAATVSRLRIKSGAHSLSSLLPSHLQVTRSALEENIVSGWVNIFKTSLKDTIAYLENCGYTALPRDRDMLEPLTYKTDHLLPRYLHIMPSVREDLIESPLLENHHIVMQERTFCLGPAVMAQLLKNYALSGKVAQTHINSPVTMAYFANLLINNDKIESLLVFGAGYRKEACEQYLKELGVKNTLVFAENFATLSPESRVLDNVIAVLATPPNTNSSVVEPVDLQILQQLTADDFAPAPHGDHINKFLQDTLYIQCVVQVVDLVDPVDLQILQQLTADDFASAPRGDHINKFLWDTLYVQCVVQVVDPVDLAMARGGDLQILQQLTADDFASAPRGDHINKFLWDTLYVQCVVQVVDPVDLAVARGGDLQILQQLTADDFASAPRGDHINKFLWDTLYVQCVVQVVDPVDLAVARGGDLQILQQLTADDFASAPRGDHINKFLRDQRDTLRRGMSKPQIQFIVYETHSRFHCENEEMANNLVNELNNYAREVHLEELRRAQGETQERERSQAESTDSPADVPTIRVDEELSLPLPSPVQSVQIPPSDLFEVAELPDLCPNLDNCLDLESEGTYIAVIKRKEITRLDPKYMIQMAEARGLFGRPDATPKAKTPGQTARAKAALAALQARSDSFEKNKTKVKVEMDRIAAPTRASMLRDVRAPSTKDCPRFAHHLAHDGTPSYMSPDEISRKSFLSPAEEEELIRRLYICPRLNLFPPKLYEDLPPLKFWDSPASVVECYLQRKIFQKRLQMAYEFNQNKETFEQIPLLGAAEETPEQLSTAVNQLSDDINYYSHLAQPFSCDSTLKIKGDRNKDLWDKVRPEEIFTVPCENVMDVEKDSAFEPSIKLRDDIRKRFSDYKNYYRLQNLRRDDKPPLATTIDEPCRISEESLSEERISFKGKKGSITSSKEKTSTQSSEFSESYPEELKYSFGSGKLPGMKSAPKYNLPRTATIQEMLKNARPVSDDMDSLLPQLPLDSTNTNYNKRGTSLTFRDSVELAHKRISKISRSSLFSDISDLQPPHLQMATYKDSFMMLSDKLPKLHHDSLKDESTQSSDFFYPDYNMPILLNQRHRSTIINHQDSLLLTLKRISSKEKTHEKPPCEVCNVSESKSLQFLCDLHATSQTSNQPSYRCALTKTKSCISHRDSVEIAKKRVSCKDIRKSVGCQVNEINLQEGLSQLKDGSTKGSKMSRQIEESVKSESIKKSPQKLNKYLMHAVQINQVSSVDGSFLSN